MAIGLGVLAGVLTRLAAAGGMLLSFGLFLTVSFHSRPYYTGADIGYLFAFTPLLIAGAGDRLTLPALVDHLTGASSLRPRYRQVDEERRQFLLLGGLGAFGLAAAVVTATVGRVVGAAKPPRPTTNLSGSAPTRAPATSTTAPAVGPSTTAPAATTGTRIGPASGVPVGGAASFQDPSSGTRPSSSNPKPASSWRSTPSAPTPARTVEFAQSQNILVCPCHNSLFNAGTGAVEQGPAASGLRPIPITQSSDGQLFAT